METLCGAQGKKYLFYTSLILLLKLF